MKEKQSEMRGLTWETPQRRSITARNNKLDLKLQDILTEWRLLYGLIVFIGLVFILSSHVKTQTGTQTMQINAKASVKQHKPDFRAKTKL